MYCMIGKSLMKCDLLDAKSIEILTWRKLGVLYIQMVSSVGTGLSEKDQPLCERWGAS